MGHEVRLMPPAYVKPFVKRHKNDAVDAEAICEPAQRPSMRFVAVKSEEHQAAALVFRTRDLAVKQRTQIANAIRGHLAEYGWVAFKGAFHLTKLADLLEDGEIGETLPEAARPMFAMMVDMLGDLDKRIAVLDKEITRRAREDEVARRLMTISGIDGGLYAINPEAGFFGVAPGTGHRTNRNAINTLSANCIFTNTALTADGDVWREGLTKEPPADLTDWRGNPYDPAGGRPAAHPNARFAVPASQCPTIAPEWEWPEGVPISAILFGGRRATAVPLVTEAFDWEHGVYLAANIASEGTAAAENTVGELRRDPFAMLPFCGYHIADYFAHWLRIGAAAQSDAAGLPRMFMVNWFRKDATEKFIWPGFGDNVRALKWVTERIDRNAMARSTPIGLLPEAGALDLSGLTLSSVESEALLSVDPSVWVREA
jgi:hypothetical protein